MEFSEIQEVKNMVDFRSSKMNEFIKEKNEVPERKFSIELFNKSDEELDDILNDIKTEANQTQNSESKDPKSNEKEVHFNESKINNFQILLLMKDSPQKKAKEPESSSSHKTKQPIYNWSIF